MANNIMERLRSGKGLEIKPLKVNGVNFPMHTDYLFEKQKVYTKEPTRGLTGQISSFPEKFFVPYFTVTYAVLPITEYSAMMKALSVDEVTVEYYDTWENKYDTAKFYAQKPEMTKMQPLVFSTYDNNGEYVGDEVKYGFIQNTTIVFAGTLGEISKININFFANANDSVGVVPTVGVGYTGEEFEMPSQGTLSRAGYKFVGWQDAQGTLYTSGQVYVYGAVPTEFFAKWEPTTVYTLGLSYGFDKNNIMVGENQENTVPESISVTYNGAISALPTKIDVLTTDESNNKVILRDNAGQKVYTFSAWNKLPSGNGSTLSNGMAYNIQGNSVAHAIFSVQSYTVSFYKEESDIAIGKKWATVSGEYGTSFAVNEPIISGHTKVGWYYKDSNGVEGSFSATKIPAGNYNVYAKWSNN